MCQMGILIRGVKEHIMVKMKDTLIAALKLHWPPPVLISNRLVRVHAFVYSLTVNIWVIDFWSCSVP